MKCPECGNEIHKGHRYCSHCMYELTQAQFSAANKRKGCAPGAIILVLVILLVIGGIVFALGHFLHWFDGGGSPAPEPTPQSVETAVIQPVETNTQSPVQPAETPGPTAGQQTTPVQPQVSAQATADEVVLTNATMRDVRSALKDMMRQGKSHLRIESASFTQDDLERLLGDHAEIEAMSFYGVDLDSWPQRVELEWLAGTRIYQAIENGTTDQLSQQDSQILQKAQDVITALIRPGMSDRDKELALHDYIINNADYAIEMEGLQTNSCYGFFEHGKVQCSGYTDTFYLLGKMAGLEVEYHAGTSEGETHAWNLVRLNGLWYVVDATWDDPQGGGEENGLYFNVPLRLLAEEREWSTDAMPDGNYAGLLDAQWYYGDVPQAADAAQALNVLSAQLNAGNTSAMVLLTAPDAVNDDDLAQQVMNRHQRSVRYARIVDEPWAVIYKIELS